ncbi:ArdC family protein [Dethiothermospora halolimnae]|uniref:ArdC family protein n=1 Tax=Dethiothermospora halolimnae TaxID=3114390 RepID=UPI003CCBAC3B
MSKKSVYQIIQERYIKKIKDAIKDDKVLPWEKPWVGGFPRSHITGKFYRGINTVLLEKGGEYITYKQIKKLRQKDKSIKLKKGCKQYQIIFWSPFTKKVKNEETGETEEKTQFFLRYYKVYHLDDVKNLEPKWDKFKGYEHQANKLSEDLIDNYVKNENIDFQEIKGSSRAFYSPPSDTINVPDRSQFENIQEFYSTCFHEIIHSTGNKSRLNRDLSGNFGSSSYSKEELVAEFGASFVRGLLGIESTKTEENSVAYLNGWLKAIREDLTLLTSACSKAQKACDFVLEKGNIDFNSINAKQSA